MWPVELEMIIVGHAPFYILDVESQHGDDALSPARDDDDVLGVVDHVINFFRWVYRAII